MFLQSNIYTCTHGVFFNIIGVMIGVSYSLKYIIYTYKMNAFKESTFIMISYHTHTHTHTEQFLIWIDPHIFYLLKPICSFLFILPIWLYNLYAMLEGVMGEGFNSLEFFPIFSRLTCLLAELQEKHMLNHSL